MEKSGLIMRLKTQSRMNMYHNESDDMKVEGKRILFLCYYQSPYGGNFVPSLMALERRLICFGAKCIYLFPEKAEERYWFKRLNQDSDVLTMDFSLGKFSFIQTLDRIIKEKNIDVVYSHFGKLTETEVVCWLNSKVYGVGHIHSDFSMGHISIKDRIKNYIIYKLLANKMSFISVSPAFVAYNPKKIKYTANALATERISCEHIEGITVRKKLGILDDEILCEIYGWSPDVKGVDIAVKAVGSANKVSQCKIKLAIVCGMAFNKREMQEYIRTHTPYNGDEEFLLYLEPTEDVFSYHEAADILIVSSRSEGFSYTLLEMLSLGKRCVVSNLPGTKWSSDFPNVFQFSCGSLRQCEEKLGEAIKSSDKTNIQSILKIKKEYSIDYWTKQVANVLLNCR